jgi:flagellar biosynthesis/type III secretory pathway M-ring protein FliF/YscJ
LPERGWKWIVGAAVVWFVIREANRRHKQSMDAAAAERAQLAAVAARADEQHAQVVLGNDRQCDLRLNSAGQPRTGTRISSHPAWSRDRCLGNTGLLAVRVG